jgi:hypothetical protein
LNSCSSGTPFPVPQEVPQEIQRKKGTEVTSALCKKNLGQLCNVCSQLIADNCHCFHLHG